MTNSRLIYCYDQTGKSTSHFMALDTVENLTGNAHNLLRPTPFGFADLRIDDDLSFYVQKMLLNGIQFTRVIFVDKMTEKPLASLSGLETNTHYYCEIGAVTEFISNDAAAFYYVNPAICDVDHFFAAKPKLQIHSVFYNNKKQLFIEMFNEYRKIYIRNELYSSQLLCNWINWSIENINSEIWVPINESKFDNRTEVTITDTVMANDVSPNDLVKNNSETPNRVLTYAAVAAAASVKQSKTESTNKPIVFSINNKPTQKLDPKLKTATKQSKKPIILEKTDMPTNKSNLSALNKSSSAHDIFSFSALASALSSDDEADDENIKGISKPTQTNISRRKKTNIASKKRENSYDEDEFLDAICAQQKQSQNETSVALAIQVNPEEKIAKILHNAAKNRSEALRVVMLSLGYLVVTPPILTLIGGIANNSWNDVDSNNRLKNPLVFAVFSALCISQVLCALFSAKHIAHSSRLYANNHPAFNPVLFGYEASKKQNKANDIMRLDDKIEGPRTLPSMKL